MSTAQAFVKVRCVVGEINSIKRLLLITRDGEVVVIKQHFDIILIERACAILN